MIYRRGARDRSEFNADKTKLLRPSLYTYFSNDESISFCWENEGWPMPVVEESYNPDRTRLSLEFAKKQTIKTSEEEKEPKRSQKGAEKEPIKGAERKKEILKLIKVNSTITQVEIMKELDLTRKQVQKDMKELQEMHIIAREGTNRRGRWIIVKENK